jgi:hypothetical protein
LAVFRELGEVIARRRGRGTWLASPTTAERPARDAALAAHVLEGCAAESELLSSLPERKMKQRLDALEVEKESFIRATNVLPAGRFPPSEDAGDRRRIRHLLGG